MEKLHKPTITIMVLCTFMIFSTLAQTVLGTPYADMLTEFLKLGPASALKLNSHGRSGAVIDKALIQLYRDNGFQPFWIEDGKPGQRGIDIVAALKDADQHGLTPSDYLLSNIDQFWRASDTAGLVKLDIVLTLGMMRYIADQREGHLQPRQLDPELFATAGDVEVDWKALFQSAFKAPDMKTFLAEQAPTFWQYRQLQKKLAEYRLIAAGGGWQPVPAGPLLKPGMVDSRIGILKKRLAITGDLHADNTQDAIFDQQLVEAVKKFQKRHNLSPDGTVGKQTLSAMNVPVEFRIQQIIINMEQYRWLGRQKDTQMVAVNIAGFEAVAGRPGKYELSMPVIVGKTYHKTPVFSGSIEYVVFNPYWNLPPSIARTEVLPKLKKDPAYLKKQNMRIFQGWKPGAPELDATKIDWKKVSEKAMNQYHIRQDPGPDNSLGTLKIIFPNKYDVYLHDTPAHGLFKQTERAFSHGCIRMGRPAEMAAWVLGGEAKGWSVERVKQIVATRKQKVVTLDQPMPVYILYRTAFVRPEDGTLSFYNDIYGRDKLLMQALFERRKLKDQGMVTIR